MLQMRTCFASSLVGARTMTRGVRPLSLAMEPALASVSTMGSTKASVLPQPVLQSTRI